jgi:uncharacterized protein (DUF433 family)
MNLPDFLTRGQRGEIRLTGHRIDLYHVLSLYQAGHTAEMIQSEFPTLSPGLVSEVLSYYLDNRSEVEVYLAEVDARIDRQRSAARPGPGILRLRELKESRSRPSG